MELFDKIKEIFGGYGVLASLLGVCPATVSMWKVRGQIPQKHCADIVNMSGGEITYAELRPDLYPKDFDGYRAA